MFITIVIGLYTSRILLITLGNESFGLFNVVNGFVILLSFLNTVMISTTFRFIAFEMGKNNEEGINTVFSSSIIIHVFMGLLLIVFGFTIGVFYVKNYLNTGHINKSIALYVFYFSIFSSFVNILSIPYQGVLTAKEDFNILALGSILLSILTLLATISLKHYQTPLKTYAVFYFLIQIIIASFYFFSCKIKYKRIKFYAIFNLKKIKEMFSFSIWILFGAAASVGKTQGSSLLLNLFFGPKLNTAFGIASQVNSQLNQFAGNIGRAAIPQITKSYSAGDKDKSILLTSKISKYSFFVLFLVVSPLLLETNSILKIWLGNVPPYTVVFCQLILINLIIEILNTGIPALVQANGNIKNFQMITSIISLFSLVLTYIFFKSEFSPYYLIFAYIFTSVVNLFLKQFLLNKIEKFDKKQFLLDTYLPSIKVMAITLPILFIDFYFLPPSTYRLIFNLSFLIVIISIIIYFFGLNTEEKVMIKKYANSVFVKLKIK